MQVWDRVLLVRGIVLGRACWLRVIGDRELLGRVKRQWWVLLAFVVEGFATGS